MAGLLVILTPDLPTPVMNTSIAGLVRAAQEFRMIKGVRGLSKGLRGILNDQFVNLATLTDEHIYRLTRTPGSVLQTERYYPSENELFQILEMLEKWNARYLAVLGGLSAMRLAYRIEQYATRKSYDLAVIGLPHSIVNDLAGTDHALGYASAARLIALAARDVGTDLETTAWDAPVCIIETPDQEAGWLTAAAAAYHTPTFHAPHLLYTPELALDEARFLRDIELTHQQYGRVLAVVSAGLRTITGQYYADQAGGTAAYLARLVMGKLNFKTRSVQLGVFTRASSNTVSPLDRSEALRLGARAAELLVVERSGLILGLERQAAGADNYSADFSTLPLTIAAQAPRILPREYFNEAGNMITPAFIEYIQPLLGRTESYFQFP